MSLQQIDLSKTLTDDQIYNCLMENYAALGKDWISHQWNWINSVYWAFNDHYKYMIVISLVEKTMQFYNQMNFQSWNCKANFKICVNPDCFIKKTKLE